MPDRSIPDDFKKPATAASGASVRGPRFSIFFVRLRHHNISGVGNKVPRCTKASYALVSFHTPRLVSAVSKRRARLLASPDLHAGRNFFRDKFNEQISHQLCSPLYAYPSLTAAFRQGPNPTNVGSTFGHRNDPTRIQHVK